jgi:hypothetical protein
MLMTSDGSLNITGDEMIQWINNWCYNIVVSPDPQRRRMRRCVVPLGKTAAWGDLFDHMNESRPPQRALTHGNSQRPSSAGKDRSQRSSNAASNEVA